MGRYKALNRHRPYAQIGSIRCYEIAGEQWFLLEDIRRELRQPKLTGKGPARYLLFDRGPWITVRLRLVNQETLLGYLRQYGDKPMDEWRAELQAFA